MKHKEKTRQRILDSAARSFRQHGYDGVGIDGLMAAAGLTRGGFYAHFRSKMDLFTEVVRHQHPLLKMLQGRCSTDLWHEMHQIFAAYLTQAHLEEILLGCSMASLSSDISRAPLEVKAAFEKATDEIIAEMARGTLISDANPALSTALTLAVGAVSMAGAVQSAERQTQILAAAHNQFVNLVEKAKQEAEDAR